ncbi:YSIRK-type signal peptide-containing protein [Peptostreptococcus equinus]|uniref:InlB B-repeat-containing protein n=1 Tax=Peptostreptococcus equinus TaxID=3003601 RepID=A0ABY7JPS9_9FIRM|nr:InlB B-repeat-containing protein [Peptostreptococcus sp. CBA3647]WAW15371.1 InlB B-repeat-containing protein [Peptostreptococcus sp. CBA3647]
MKKRDRKVTVLKYVKNIKMKGCCKVENKNIFQKIIEEKRKKCSSERPKYGLRKLSVGIVSCILGYMIFLSPTSVQAAEITPDTSISTSVSDTTIDKNESIPVTTSSISEPVDNKISTTNETKDGLASTEESSVTATIPTASESFSTTTSSTENTSSEPVDTTSKLTTKLGTESTSNDSSVDTTLSEPTTEIANNLNENLVEPTAEQVQLENRTINNEVYYTINGEVDGPLDYGRTDYKNIGTDGSIHLNVTKWATDSAGWGYLENGPYNGRYILNFFKEEFYKEIESIEVNGVMFEKEADGALWKVPINTNTFNTGAIGVVTNHDVIIRLKNGATLDSLGLSNEKISFTTIWVTGQALADIGGYDNGFILQNNPNIPELPAKPSDGNDSYLGTGLNALNNDGTQSKDGNFTSGSQTKVVSYNSKEKVINSIVSFKPDQNFLQSNSGWVLYINEIIPPELLKYIDTNNVFIGVSDPNGNFKTDAPIKLTVDPNGDGHISTKDTDIISIIGGDWSKVEKVRTELDKNVFYGALGQSKSYTIKYKLKDGLSNQEFAKKLNEYIITNNNQINFESWLTADFVDTTNSFLNIRKPDGGKTNKRIQNSYANAFLEVFDNDKDGLYNFVEQEIGSNIDDVDTDDDGVPDNVEFLDDKTSPIDAKSYLVSKPNISTQNIIANEDQSIEGTVPKTEYFNPADKNSVLKAVNTDAGNVIVKAYKYVDGDQDYTDNEVKAQTIIPFSDLESGKFKIDVASGTFAEGDKVVLVAYSPDGKNPMISDTVVTVGALKVAFDVNNGKWNDNTTDDKYVNIVNGKVDQPEAPVRDGYKFLGWASSSTAIKPEENLLTNLTSNKKVFAVWQENFKATVINPPVLLEKKPITDTINVITTNQNGATIEFQHDDGQNSGLKVDENMNIVGTPIISNWGDKEEERTIMIHVVIDSKDKSESQTVSIPVTVQRDTDGDGTPDVTDTDDDGDGIPDDVEKDKGSDSKNPNSIPSTPINPVGKVDITNGEQTLNEKTPIKDVNITTENPDAKVVVDGSKLPEGITYDETKKVVSGTPEVKDWGKDEEEREIKIPVTVENPDGSKVTKEIVIKVQRDTDGDGTPDVTDTDDDGDGIPDDVEKDKGSDSKNPNSIPSTPINPVGKVDITNGEQTLNEKTPIKDVNITTENPDAKVVVDGSKLPEGITYDETKKVVSGTPEVKDWGKDEEEREIKIPVTVENPDGSKVTKEIVIKVQRDTDGDGTPDVTDTDDDGDGIPDDVEKDKGSDSKNPNSIPSTPINPVGKVDITNGEQTLNEKTPIKDVNITTENPDAKVVVDGSKLPEGITYDETKKVVSGTPEVKDWGKDEEEREIKIPVTVENPDGSKVTKEIVIKVQRDTDGDGTPDVTDTDDDGDGIPDDVEKDKGSDSKNPNSIPSTPINPVGKVDITNGEQTLNEKTPIKDVNITTENPDAKVVVDGSKLPEGITYDETKKVVSGTPEVKDWGKDEEEREIKIPVTVENPDGSKVTKEIVIKVQRDIDGDGTPDVTDTDDDGDGIPDDVEKDKGSDSKNPNSIPSTPINPVGKVDITNGEQTLNEKTPIKDVNITTENPDAKVVVDGSKLPEGITYDETKKVVSGTPEVKDWGKDEEEREIKIPVTVENPDGSKVTKEIVIKVQRDIDGDGTPDVTDTDDDGDGIPDDVEKDKGSDSKNPNSIPSTPINPVGKVDITNGEQTLNEKTPIKDVNITTENPDAKVVVDGSKLPEGITYDETKKVVSGTPEVKDWGKDEEEREIKIPVTVENPDGSKVTKEIVIKVQRDTDGDGTPDVTDTDDDGDGIPDDVEKDKGSDSKNPNSIPSTPINPVGKVDITNGEQTLNEKTPIKDVNITTENPDAKVVVDGSKLPEGITYDETKKVVSGTPEVKDWGKDEEEREIKIPVTVENPDGSKVTKEIVIKVQRDTDGDGTPDVTDTDDDGDGIPDDVEKDKGSDSKNPNSIPSTPINPVGKVDITNGEQTLNEKTPIKDVNITTENPDAKVVVDGSKLPEGITYDETKKVVSGTPEVKDWGKDEEEREIKIPVTVENPDGSKVTKEIVIKVQRDTDGDGTPDVTDTDDDGDGIPDDVEKDKGSDSKNPNSIPSTPINPVGKVDITNGEQTLNEKTPIKDVNITTENPDAKVVVDGSKLPEGITYDETKKVVSGTPEVKDWGKDEEEREIKIPVTVENPDGSKVTKEIVIKVQRDIDGDGTPDVTDTDDDGDGIPDDVEKDKGSDSKNPNSIPSTPINPVGKVDITNGEQTLNEKTPIKDVNITTENPDAKVVVDGSKLPEGITYDETKKVVSGTPEVKDWGKDEEEREIKIPVTVENPDGSKVTKEIVIKVQRDIDGDGTPDVTDTDDDGDGIPDDVEKDKGSDSKNPNSIPSTPINPVGKVDITNGEQTLNEKTPIKDVNITTENPDAKVVVDGSKLPEGITYDETKKVVSGTPEVKDWGKDEEEREIKIPVTVENPDGSKVTKEIVIKVQRDTDGDGTPDVTDTDDDGDGIPDDVEKDKGSDSKNPNSIPSTPINPVGKVDITNGEQTLNEKTPIKDVNITTENPDAKVVVDGSKLPEGITYDETKKVVSGTPEVKDWGKDEEEREIKIPVTVENPDGSKVTKEIVIKVQRDTDGDGTPDVTDTDDDGDGIPDDVEKDKGSDSKNPNSIPSTPINPVGKVDITNGEQTLNEKTPIKDVNITTENPDAKVVVDGSKLPEGITYDETKKVVSGTPEVKDWGKDEEEREIKIPVTVENPDGSKVTKEIVIKVQRDIDGDGTPDVTDTDDDGDGIPDDVEKDKGSDSKNPNSIPSTPINPVGKVDITNGNQTNNSNNANNHNIKGKNPKTGDTSNITIYTGLMSIAGTLLLLLGFRKKREEEEEN